MPSDIVDLHEAQSFLRERGELSVEGGSKRAVLISFAPRETNVESSSSPPEPLLSFATLVSCRLSGAYAFYTFFAFVAYYARMVCSWRRMAACAKGPSLWKFGGWNRIAR